MSIEQPHVGLVMLQRIESTHLCVFISLRSSAHVMYVCLRVCVHVCVCVLLVSYVYLLSGFLSLFVVVYGTI